MAGQRQTTVEGAESDADLTAKVESWLNSEGYRLEFRTHEAFVSHGLSGLMGFYTGGSETPCEIDVIAQKCNEYEGSAKGPYVALRVMCECKYSQSLPWVLLCTGRAGFSPSDWFTIPKSDDVETLFSDEPGLSQQFFRTPYFTVQTRIAHNIVPALRKQNDRDDAYKALQKLAHAAWHLARVGSEQDIHLSSLIVPCIVVETPLFAARFKDGRITPERVDFGRITWRGTGRLTLIDVVQFGYVDQYAEMIADSFKDMFAAMHSALVRRPARRRNMAAKPPGF